jgi:hypothetical protein
VARDLAIIAALALAGCGASAPERAPTKARFIARADAICGDEVANLQRAAARDHASLASFSQVPRLLRQLAGIQQAATTRLESLPQPPGERGPIMSWLTARTVTATFELDAAEAPAGEESTAAKDMREALARASARLRALSHGYGFSVCGAGD